MSDKPLSSLSQHERDVYFMNVAVKQAQKSLSEGGIPIGSVLVSNDDFSLLGEGHNQRIQQASSILHGEMDCLKNAGRLLPSQYQNSTIYSTLSPCEMCTGAIALYKIPRVVMGEHENFQGPSMEYLRSKGVEVVNLNDETCKKMLGDFIAKNPTLWNEDIGEDEK
eukprot:CAMPEP_0117449980 /NCGR_PEP_ID=MMETSP0759-20121206/8228_1 /TAXON_ID=63605 /ORGANISM="Percolomonas cosmopolitus, Strain WS" /LENGTH=165 /DNA_ID=CAMNT_0005242479 /DNA_START=241 /DNA_END=738 /DNA_ORIENTATION=-